MHDGNDVGKGKIIKYIYANICNAILVCNILTASGLGLFWPVCDLYAIGIIYLIMFCTFKRVGSK